MTATGPTPAGSPPADSTAAGSSGAGSSGAGSSGVRRLRPWLPWVALLAVVVVVLVVARDPGSDSPEARADHIASRLKCPDCLALSVADSDTDSARAIRTQIANQIAAGRSDGEILRFFADTYGEQILLAPESEGLGAVVWALPIGAVVLGAFGLGLAIRRWRRDPARTATAADRALVERFRRVRQEGTR